MERDIGMLRRTARTLTLTNPLIFGGGTCKTLADVTKAAKTDAGGIELGSISPHMKKGNDGPNIFYAHWVNGVLIYTLNSLGLINPGKEAVSVWAKEAIQRAHDSDKKIGINIVGDTAEEIIDMVLWALSLGFDWVTINAGCPNKFDENGRPIGTLTFDEAGCDRLFEMLDSIDDIDPSVHRIWWKPSPFTDTMGGLKRHVRLVARSKKITGYIANNTVAHCFCWGPDGKPTITPGGGLAGMGGPATKPISQGHLRLIDTELPPHFTRIGAGGVTFGEDVADYLRSGADFAQATSVCWAHPKQGGALGYEEANRILAELMVVPDLESVLQAK